MGLRAWCCSRRVSSFHGHCLYTLREADSGHYPATPESDSESGGWDSIHVFEAVEQGRTAHYKLTSTVILHLGTKNNKLGTMDLGGNMTRQIEQDMPVDDDGSHIFNVGKLVEDMELKMRNMLQEVYFGKAKDVVGDLRSKCSCLLFDTSCGSNTSFIGIAALSGANRDRAAQREMISEWSKRGT